MIDDTALPKKGTLSVGVARQYCGQLGKKANCQCLVSLTLAQREVPVPVALRLFLPEEWTSNAERCAQAGVPAASRRARSKGEIALSELDRLRETGLRFGTVLADAGYGTSAAFRHGLDVRGLKWAVGIARNQKVYAADVRLVPPAGRARKPVPDQEPRPAEDVLALLEGPQQELPEAPACFICPNTGSTTCFRKRYRLRRPARFSVSAIARIRGILVSLRRPAAWASP